MGLVCEYGMKVIHNQPWCGPGDNYTTKCVKFQSWFIDNPDMGCLCCDGSSFDSTQHRYFIKNIDSWFLRMILDRNKEKICKYFNYSDVLDVINQVDFDIYTKYFFFSVQGTQLSGRMNTCLSNTIRSACYVKYIIYKSKRKIVEGKNIFFEVTGDDQIIFIIRGLKDLYVCLAYKYVYMNEDKNIAHGLGQICKIFDWYPYITGAEYLSCLVLFSYQYKEFLLIRKPDRFFALIPYTYRNSFKNANKFLKLRADLAYEVGLAYLISNPDIKLYASYAQKLKKLGMESRRHHFSYSLHKKSKVRYNKIIANLKEHLKYKQYEDDTSNYKADFNKIFEDYLCDQYSISHEDLEEYYQKLDKCTSLDDHFECELIDKLQDNISNYTIFNRQFNEVFKYNYLTLPRFVDNKVDLQLCINEHYYTNNYL